MSDRPSAPHPRIVWENNKRPFWDYRDNLEKRNKFAYRSAAIRGDEEAVLHRMGYGGFYTPGEVDIIQEHDQFLRRHIPTKENGHGPDALNWNDPIFLEAQVAYQYYRCDPTPAKQEPVAYDGLDLKWIRDLGKGGFGVASLWEASFDDGHRMNVVIKKPVRDSRTAFEDERRWHARYRGAANITQSLDLAEIAKQHRTNPPKQRNNSQGPYQDKNTLVVEYMEHNNLGQMNHNLAYVRQKSWKGEKIWPNGALWQLFASLVKGLAEMAYNQGLMQAHGMTFAQGWRTLKFRPQREQQYFWDNLTKLPVRHDVHFDMEEYNILVGRDPDNGSVVFKLHDFSDSHSHQMEHVWPIWNVGGYWEKRRPVKTGRHLPEQHSHEWDGLVATSMHPEFAVQYAGTSFPPHKNQVAGRYGMWSNIFTIARTVECCISGMQYTHPFKAMAGRIDGEIRPPSYGWRLYDAPEGMAYRNADAYLRAVITDCMQELPASRPSLVQLLQIIRCVEECGMLEDTDEVSEFWWAATDPKEYCATGGQPAPLLPPDAPFSFEQAGAGGESSFATAPDSAKTAEKRMDLSSSPFNPPQYLGKSAGRKRIADHDPEDNRASKVQKSEQQASEADGGEDPEQAGNGRGNTIFESVYTDPEHFRRRDAREQRGSGPQLNWRDRTGLSEALERQMALSGSIQ